MSSIGDQEYSDIFKSLKHYTRRQILQMLSVRDRSFTELYETLEISSSHLDYHLQVLDKLVLKKGQKYSLAQKGRVTVNWINRMENPPKNSKINFFYKYFSIILLILVPSLLSTYAEMCHINFQIMMNGLAVTSIIILILMYPVVLVAFSNEYLMVSTTYSGFNHFFRDSRKPVF